MDSIVAEHFLNAGEFAGVRLQDLMLAELLLLLSLFLGDEFFLAVHNITSSGLFEQCGKGLARAVKFAADGISGLLGERADLFVT